MGIEKNDYGDAADLFRRQGFSVAELAAHYGITRQAMYKVLRRAGVKIATGPRKVRRDHVRRTMNKRRGE